MFPSLSVITGIVLVLSYFFYIPFPEHASDPMGKSFSAATRKMQRLAVSIGETFGYTVEVELARFLDDAYAITNNNPDIESTYADFGGVKGLIHRPRTAVSERLPCFIYFHGGGWIHGSTASYRGFTEHLSSISQSVVISIEYRLAPEHRFPIPFEDCLKATQHILANPKELGIDVTQLSLAGDQNGGTLALAVAFNISKEVPRKRRSWNIRLVGCFYSPFQVFNFNLPSYIQYAEGPGVLHTNDVIREHLYHMFGEANKTFVQMFEDDFHTTVEMRRSDITAVFDVNLLPYSFRQFHSDDPITGPGNEELAAKVKDLVLDYRLSPMLLSEDDLELIPPTYFIAAEFDPLRDESFMFYGYIRELDMNTRYHEYYRTEQHGFLMNFKSSEIAREAIEKFVQHFQKRCTFMD